VHNRAIAASVDLFFDTLGQLAAALDARRPDGRMAS
jgi:hypothetical protein